MSWYESRIDRAIREAQERGEFDDLPGTGKPLPGAGEAYDEQWWLKQLVIRENLTGIAPASLRVRKEAEEFLDTVAAIASEREVRSQVAELNGRIEQARRGLLDGPPVVVEPFDPEDVVRIWRSTKD